MITGLAMRIFGAVLCLTFEHKWNMMIENRTPERGSHGSPGAGQTSYPIPTGEN